LGLSLLAACALQPAAEISSADVDLFFRIYDESNGLPSAEVLQSNYLEAGSEGVRQFIPHRIVSAERLAEQIEKKREVYQRARRCAETLPKVRERVSRALSKLRRLLPSSKFPPVTILVGRATSGGTTGPAGVLIGLETVCTADWMQANLEDRLVYLIAHEYIHVQQPASAAGEDPTDGRHTVLQISLGEGVADFVGELIAGSASNSHLQTWTQGREAQIADAFVADMNGTDVRKWVYTGPGTPEQPGDLGYWVGYRIAKCFYTKATDKKRAVRELIELKNPAEILQQSSWREELAGARCFP
jgi:hypothetical protein